MSEETKKSQASSNCRIHESRFTKDEEDEDGTNVPLFDEVLDLTSFNQFSTPFDISDPIDILNPIDSSNPFDESDIYPDDMFPIDLNKPKELVNPVIQQTNNLVQQPLYVPPKKRKTKGSNPERTPFHEEFMRIYSGRPNATIHKYMVNYIIIMVNQIIDGLQLESEYFNREAKRSIYYCYYKYRSQAPLILEVLKALKQFGVINYDEDHKKWEKIDENAEMRKDAGFKYSGRKLLVPNNFTGEENLGFDLRGSQALIQNYFEPKFEPVKDLIIQHLKQAILKL